jgi:hypothetical protein
LETCCVELIVLNCLIGVPLKWPVSVCEAVYEDYLRSKHKPAEVNLPAVFEVAVEAGFANLFLEDQKVEKFDHWIDRAVLDAAGNKEMQEYLRACKAARQRIDLRQLLGRPSKADPMTDTEVAGEAEGSATPKAE